MKTIIFKFSDGQKEISKGDIICLIPGISKRAAVEAEIISIGSKYITAKERDYGHEYKFDISTGREAGNVTGTASILYSSLEARKEVLNKQSQLSNLCEFFRSGKVNKLTLNQIESIKQIIELGEGINS